MASQFSLFVITIIVTMSDVTWCQNNFCYDKNDLQCGPHSSAWGPLCRQGKSQSPINFKLAPMMAWEKPGFSFAQQNISFNQAYREGAASGFIINNGHTVLISINQDLTSTMTLRTSLYPDPYIFSQVHCHFDSEHKYEFLQYPLECHFVHYNVRHRNLGEAINSGQMGAALIIGIWYQDRSLVGQSMAYNEAMEPFTKNLMRVRTASNTMVRIEGQVNIYRMLNPITHVMHQLHIENEGWLDAYCYRGSLTTPVDGGDHACTEGMHWLVFRNPQKISPQQVAGFYALMNAQGQPMRGNFRETQALNERVVTPVRLHVHR